MKVRDPLAWVDPETITRITAAVQQSGTSRLKPIHEEFQGEISHEQIRIVLQYLRNANQCAPVS